MLLLSLACSTTTTPDDTAFEDTATYHHTEDPFIESIDVVCGEGAHTATVWASGWFDEVTLRVIGLDGTEASGSSTVPVDYDPDGAWQKSDVTATGVECTGDVTYHLAVTGLYGDDCRTWGEDPDALGTGCSDL
ncbi:MAG: hypothetical protein GY913_33170 [Proteobacteria bacterium]|nr:hypothetical protein [Pseudomonadota bacterium]MCP4921777.1 hypothetical protein [Pseudomonadota bacterium]